VLEPAVAELAPVVGVKAACEALGRSRATFYRHRCPRPPAPPRPRAPHPAALTPVERQGVLDVLHAERFCDQAPTQVWAVLLDEGVYLCSVPSMYRILRDEGEVRERRRLAHHPTTVKPELVARGPNQVWSWDITKLLGPVKWTYYYLYVILDVFSRYAVGWAVAPRETAALAEQLIAACIHEQAVPPGQLTVHADRGSSMTSKPVAHLLADLGVTRSHSRPHTSNDNPYSESHFKTLKYQPDFPARFGSRADAAAFCDRFFSHYNFEHRHSGIGLHTPADVHHGRAPAVRAHRQTVLNAAYAAHPERFVRHPPQAPKLPTVAWINQPPETIVTR